MQTVFVSHEGFFTLFYFYGHYRFLLSCFYRNLCSSGFLCLHYTFCIYGSNFLVAAGEFHFIGRSDWIQRCFDLVTLIFLQCYILLVHFDFLCGNSFLLNFYFDSRFLAAL